jgi:hypothetical protein
VFVIDANRSRSCHGRSLVRSKEGRGACGNSPEMTKARKASRLPGLGSEVVVLG